MRHIAPDKDVCLIRALIGKTKRSTTKETRTFPHRNTVGCSKCFCLSNKLQSMFFPPNCSCKCYEGCAFICVNQKTMTCQKHWSVPLPGDETRLRYRMILRVMEANRARDNSTRPQAAVLQSEKVTRRLTVTTFKTASASIYGPFPTQTYIKKTETRISNVPLRLSQWSVEQTENPKKTGKVKF